MCSSSKNGKLLTTMPSRHRMTARCTVWRTSWLRVAPRASLDSIAYTTDTPITNTKVGNTRSVAVRPFHAAWFMKCHEPRPPLLFTMIMNAMVIPRATSRDSSLGACTDGCTVLVMAFGPLRIPNRRSRERAYRELASRDRAYRELQSREPRNREPYATRTSVQFANRATRADPDAARVDVEQNG